MTRSIVEAYDKLIQRAGKITEGAPFFMAADDYARLSFESDEVAVLSWPEAQSGYYNSCSIEKQSVKFPAALLWLSPEAFDQWKTAERVKYEAAQAENNAAARRLREMQERAALADLKRKYPNG